MARPTLRTPPKLRLDTPSSGRMITGKKQISGPVGRRASGMAKRSDQPELNSPAGRLAIKRLARKFGEPTSEPSPRAGKRVPLKRTPLK